MDAKPTDPTTNPDGPPSKMQRRTGFEAEEIVNDDSEKKDATIVFDEDYVNFKPGKLSLLPAKLDTSRWDRNETQFDEDMLELDRHFKRSA